MAPKARHGDARPEQSRDHGALTAGAFADWTEQIDGALRGERDAEVPCGDCTACCTASQFVHIGPDEIDTLAHVPAELLFPAPRSPQGHVLLGYDERGHCPMLINARCSIYAHRPRACRTYDCRIFSAAGVEPSGAQYVKIQKRVRRWRFTYGDPADEVRHEAVRAAARYLSEHAGLLADGTGETAVALLALELHDLFLRRDDTTGRWSVALPEFEAVRKRVGASKR
jgi:Fe-S-cluster containining protein